MFPSVIFTFLAAFQFHTFEFLVCATDEKSIFILAGQSNMAGRGGVTNGTWDGCVPHECRPDPRILRLNPKLMWEEAREPLHGGIDTKPCGVGPGMSFANSVLQRDPCLGVIGSVTCAPGGTNITEWKQGSDLYYRLLKRANAALRDEGKIRAILWYQGESDSADETRAKMYKKRLIEFFLHIRRDLPSPVLPIIQVALASNAGLYYEVVRKAQLEIKLPNVICVDAKGLEVKKNDTLHLTTSAQVHLGKMLANAFFDIGIYSVLIKAWVEKTY
ncbi:probable carbohydrate esterase At4g34215 [Olea europaea var. sylvestris]|uniref:probable carbohydrate esterase At4g34215 n=1 Tax=Olea europaea var. sylvestris TaxID=158386 RepID=UPI000C1D573C|nr:probable carbohydrate esterase At4g34215 [Olea europaea var. sylvestris]